MAVTISGLPFCLFSNCDGLGAACATSCLRPAHRFVLQSRHERGAAFFWPHAGRRWIPSRRGVCRLSRDVPLTGPQLVKLNRLDEALAGSHKDVEILPKSVAANNGVGVGAGPAGALPGSRAIFPRRPSKWHQSRLKRLLQAGHGCCLGIRRRDCRNAEKYESDAFDFYLNTSGLLQRWRSCGRTGPVVY